jgi:hypothetical protein
VPLELDAGSLAASLETLRASSQASGAVRPVTDRGEGLPARSREKFPAIGEFGANLTGADAESPVDTGD